MLLKTLAIQAWALVFVTISSLSAQANIFVQDRREDLFPTPTEFQPIGILRAIPDDGKWGTAFLVGQCHILTAFHVAFPQHKNPDFVPSVTTKSSFHVGRTTQSRNSPSGFSGRSLATPVKWGSFHSKTYGGLHGDWALLRLDDCLGRRFGVISLFPPVVAHKERSNSVHMAGFPEDRLFQPGISIEKNCAIKDFGPGLLVGIDCATVIGASGGPILEETDGAVYAVGIAIREMQPQVSILPNYEPSTKNLALLSESFIGEVQPVLASEMAAGIVSGEFTSLPNRQ